MEFIVFNIGWMRKYQGQTPNDKIINGGKFVNDNNTGYEVKNFLPVKDSFYGYVRTRHGTIDIGKLGAAPNADYVDGVTVIFTATPRIGGGVVVGWYQNARVWRNEQQLEDRPFFAKANQKNCRILEVDKRVFRVPHSGRSDHNKGTWCIGQSNIRFINDIHKKEEYVQKLLEYIEDPTNTVVPTPQFDDDASSSDPSLRSKVEKAAVERVVEYYKGYKCVSVEKENKGWDLEVSRGSVHLLVEVKGRSGHEARVELTPNEYSAMYKQKEKYRLAIVTDALDNPQIHIISYNESDKTWRDLNEQEVNIFEVKGARITCNSAD